MNQHTDIVVLGYIHKALAMLTFIGCVLATAVTGEISYVFLGFFASCNIYGMGAIFHWLVTISTAIQTNADWARWNYQKAKDKQSPKSLGLKSLKKDAS